MLLPEVFMSGTSPAPPRAPIRNVLPVTALSNCTAAPEETESVLEYAAAVLESKSTPSETVIGPVK